MIKLEINNRTVTAKPGQMLLDVLRDEGIDVPTLCHLPELAPSGACRMCVVELAGQNRLVPSCAFPVAPDLKVLTHSPRVLRARKTIIELLLSNHPDDCLYCVRSGRCELQSLADQHGVRERRYGGSRTIANLDLASPSIVRDPDKCILCGRCVRVCEEVQTVSAIDFVGRGSGTCVAPAFEEGLNVSSCVNCGQCIMVCPTGALRERSAIKETADALADPNRHVVIQHAPAVSVTLAEEFGIPAGTDVCDAMTGAMRAMGFSHVFETSFSADLTIMEEASELVARLTGGGTIPMMTSCSPGWIKFVEQFYPELMPNLSTCKSPQQMLGAMIKSYFAEREGLDPKDIFVVSAMPCVAKKFEAHRPELGHNGLCDIDAVLTTRELARMIRMQGIDMSRIAPSSPDAPFGQHSSAGKIFAASGGVMEAAIRTAHWLVTGREVDKLEVESVRGLEGIKEGTVDIDGLKVGVAVASGLGNARKLLDEIKAGRDDLHFIEVMTCPGGCIAGGGQPYGTDMEAVTARMKALYRIDHDAAVRTSHGNPAITHVYEDFLGEPLSHKSHELLHTEYAKRDVLR